MSVIMSGLSSGFRPRGTTFPFASLMRRQSCRQEVASFASRSSWLSEKRKLHRFNKTLKVSKRMVSTSRPTLKSFVAADICVRKQKSYPKNAPEPSVPAYLEKVYWWAYLHPNAIRTFERQWLVNLILWGNYTALRDASLDALSTPNTNTVAGDTLQVACVYGDFTQFLADRLAFSASLTVVDVAPIQIENLTNKLNDTTFDKVHLQLADAANLQYPDDSFDQVVLFFLLHEMPVSYRKQALREAVRVLKPKGRMVITDYHQPSSAPLTHFMRLILQTLEPFAMDLWHNEIQEWLPEEVTIEKELYFGGLYQRVVVIKQ